jgi:hypothetical protein
MTIQNNLDSYLNKNDTKYILEAFLLLDHKNNQHILNKLITFI